MACGRAGQKPFHAWSIIVMHISHLLLGKNEASFAVLAIFNASFASLASLGVPHLANFIFIIFLIM